MTKEILDDVNKVHIERDIHPMALRDEVLTKALAWVSDRKGKAADTALFDYCVASCRALAYVGAIENEMTPWLWILGCRGGNRVEEAQHMLTQPRG